MPDAPLQNFSSPVPVPIDDDDVTPSSLAALLESRGIDDPDSLVAEAEPRLILGAVRAWDTRSGVGPGLLAKWIRQGMVPVENKRPQERSAVERWADNVVYILCKREKRSDPKTVRNLVRRYHQKHNRMPLVSEIRRRV